MIDVDNVTYCIWNLNRNLMNLKICRFEVKLYKNLTFNVENLIK